MFSSLLLKAALGLSFAACILAGHVESLAADPPRSPSPPTTTPTSPEQETEEETPITFELVYGGGKRPRLGGSPLSGLRWLPDGEHYLQVIEGKPWKVEARTGDRERWLDPEPLARALAQIPTVEESTARSWARRTSLRTDKAWRGALFEHGDDLYYARLDGSVARRLTSTPEREELATFSPDGNFVAFVLEHDLWVVDVSTATERALTTGGSDKLRRGKASWVYFEEVFDRSWKAYWWSPDSRRLAFFETDSSRVEEFTVIDNLPNRQRVERDTYPKPGEPNPTVRLGTVSVAGGDVRWVDLSAYAAQDLLVTGVDWSQDGGTLYFYAQNRTQTWLDLCSVPAGSGQPKRLLRDSTEAWIEPPERMWFLGDGSFLITSERSGWKHIYHYSSDGELLRQVTDGEWEVRSIHEVDEESGWIYLTGTRDSHLAENLYRARIEGDELQRLTSEPGSHRVNVAPGAKYVIDSWSSIVEPTRVALLAADGARLRMLDENAVPEKDRYVWCRPKLVEIPARDGFPLPGMLILPPRLDPASRYPVWFMTYGGPHAPTVQNSFAGGRLWDQVLAQEGIIVFRCDPRSASGRGAVSAWSAYRQLGVQELADIEDAIHWLKQRPYVDGERIGMSGYSYGGFMTAYALTHSDVFAAGAAGAPVTDWRDYDSIYTERYMATPQENPEGYDASSVVGAAKDLQGRLLIVHGEIDDNVHIQNTMKLVSELQKAMKSFEVMIYPGFRHGIWASHYRKLLHGFIRRTLGGVRTRI